MVHRMANKPIYLLWFAGHGNQCRDKEERPTHSGKVWCRTHEEGIPFTGKAGASKNHVMMPASVRNDPGQPSRLPRQLPTALNPTMLAISVEMKKSLQKSAGSLNTRIPTSAVPMAPMPAHTA